MKIVLKAEWMGNRKGASLDLVDRIAEDLIKRGTAIKKRGVGRPQKDKMVRQSKNK
jgi:hypothetical protein